MDYCLKPANSVPVRGGLALPPMYLTISAVDSNAGGKGVVGWQELWFGVFSQCKSLCQTAFPRQKARLHQPLPLRGCDAVTGNATCGGEG